MVNQHKRKPTLCLTMMMSRIILLLIASNVYCNQIQLSDDSSKSSGFQEVTAAVLLESWKGSCTFIFITDGIIDFSLTKLHDLLGTESNTGMFDASLWRTNGTHSPPNVWYQQMNEVLQTSRCATLVLLSDDPMFLRTVVDRAIEEELLIWPTRLLIVTRRPLTDLHDLTDSLSFINAVVGFLQKSDRVIRCGLYIYLPYSHRKIRTASWTSYSGLTYLSKLGLFPDKFSRLSDSAEMKVVGNNFPIHVMVKKTTTASGERDFSFSGPLILVLKMLAAKMNFTYTLRQPSDGSWGYRFPNGSWNGMIGMMIRKEVDFALGPFGVTYIRSKVIDYTNPLIMDYGRILGRRGDTEVDPWGFLMPLTPFVWAGTAASLLGMYALAMFISWLCTGSTGKLSQISPPTYIRAFLQQDINTSSKNGWEKVMLGTWMLSVFILIESYSSNLMSLLAVRYISEPYQSVRDMLDDPDVTMVWVGNTAYAQYLADVDSGIFYEVKQAGESGRIKYIAAPQYLTSVNELVSRGDHVLINPLIIMKIFLTENYMEKGNCKFYVSKETFLPQTFCMVVPKHSPLRGPINEGIRAVVEGGLYNYWLDNAIPNAGSCKNPPSKITIKAALSLTNLWGVFIVLATGSTISCVVLLFEIIYAKIRNLVA